MNSNHLSSEEIISYVDSKLGEHDNERIIVHLSECEKCLIKVDAKWAEKAKFYSRSTSDKFEKRLLQNIHRANLVGSLIGLTITGFLSAIIGVIAPFLKSDTTKPTKKNK